jgi:hypothetical protein
MIIARKNLGEFRIVAYAGAGKVGFLFHDS